MMMRQQDETIDTIAGTLNTIHEQAGLMGREIGEHNEYVYRSYALPETLLMLEMLLECLTTLSAV